MADEDGKGDPKIALAGCHDSTLAAILASLGALEGENKKWPSFTSSLAVELFRKNADEPRENTKLSLLGKAREKCHIAYWFYRLTGPSESTALARDPPPLQKAAQKGVSDPKETGFPGFYVRIRYNDRPISIPGCKLANNHLDGDTSFCTFVRTLYPVC